MPRVCETHNTVHEFDEPCYLCEKEAGSRETFFERLRQTNQKRAREWFKQPVKRSTIERLLFSANEVGDEAGEVCGAVKKYVRYLWGMPGAIDAKIARMMVADEIADVIIACDLLAADLDIDIEQAIIDKFNATSERHGFKTKL